MSKPTMQDIADALSVSRITVWKALSNRPGVSDSMRAQIHQKATEMGYFHTPSQDTTATVSAQLPPPHTHRSGSRVPTGVLSFLDADYPSDCQGSFQA